MRIRTANAADTEGLAALARSTYTDAFGSSMRASDLTAHLENNLAADKIKAWLERDTVLVAETDERLVGYVQFGKCDMEQANPETDLELRRLYVLSEFQNRGIGAQLMRAALAHPDMLEAPQIFLDVWEYNDAAQRFYERFGFQVVGIIQFEVESGQETSSDLIMVRRKVAQV